MSLKKWDESGLIDREGNYYLRFVKRGAKIAFFTYGDESDLNYVDKLPGIDIIPAFSNRYGMSANKYFRFLASFLFPLRFRKRLSAYRIYKTNQMWGAWVPFLLSLITRNVFVVRCGYEMYRFCINQGKNRFYRAFVYLLSKTIYCFSKAILITSSQDASFIASRFKIPNKKIHVVPNFVDTDLFKQNEDIKPYSDRILFVGRLDRQKNLFNLMRAAAQLRIGLDIAGHGNLKTELESFSHDLGADIRFLGVYPHSQIPSLMAKYEIIILPSFYEGNPKVLLEAMSCSRAVIGTLAEGIRDLVMHGRNGILCRTDSEDIALAIKKLMDAPGERSRMGTSARAFVIENFSLDRVIQAEMQLYQELL